MTRERLKPAEVAQMRDEWLRAVHALVEQVREWAEKHRWMVEQGEREVNEELIGAYKVPMLEIGLPEGQVMLEPIARAVMGAQGRVDLYAWPTLYRVMLLRDENQSWVVRTDSGLNWPQPWEEGTFVTLAQGLLGAQ